jgi:hypothetical protein
MRPRLHCGLPAEETDKGPRCFWHVAELRRAGFDVKGALVEEIAKPDHWLEGAELESADLTEIRFDRAQLPYANLEDASLNRATLTDTCLDFACLRSADLTLATLSGSTLKGALMYGADAKCAHLEYVDLSEARLEGLNLDGAFLTGVTMSPKTASYGVRWGVPGEMIAGNFDEAARIFRALSNHFRGISNHQRSEDFYYLEMTALHLRAINAGKLPEGRWIEKASGWMLRARDWRLLSRWAWWAVHRWVWGYAVRPRNVFGWMAGVIAGFAIVYSVIGIGPPTEGQLSHRLDEGLALSFVSFATLGYGNHTPAGAFGEVLGGFEALLGVVLGSMFVVALATRYVHRA